MLPDYPKFKAEVAETLYTYFKSKVKQYCASTGDIPQNKLFEGEGMVIKRQDGEEDVTDLMLSSSEFSIKRSEVQYLTLQDLLNMMDKSAEKMAESIEKNFFKQMSELLDKKDRTFDNKGQRLTAERILEVLDSMFVAFDQNGQPQLPGIHVHPTKIENIKQEVTRLMSDPVLNKKYQALIVKKRMEC